MGRWLLESSSETGRIHYRTEDLGAVTCKERESESGQPEHPVPCENVCLPLGVAWWWVQRSWRLLEVRPAIETAVSLDFLVTLEHV